MALPCSKPASSWLLALLAAVLALGTALPSLQTESTSLAQNTQCTQVLDVMIVLDESGSVGSSNYRKVREFVSSFYKSMPVSTTGVHMGVITFSSSARLKWNLKDNRATNQSAGSSAALKLPYSSGGTNTADALRMANQHLYNASNGARSNVPKLVLLMTDGGSNSYNATVTQAKELAKKGAVMVVLGVGNGVNDRECRAIAQCGTSGTCTGYLRTDWNSVTKQVNSIIQTACKVLPQNATCSSWSSWGPCEGQCGKQGTQKSTRRELTPQKPGTPPCSGCAAPKGLSCAEQSPGLVRTQACTMPACKVDAQCGEFGAWSAWSATCGSVTRSRVRANYNKPPASGGGRTCEQQGKQQKEVEKAEKTPCPIHQTPGPWAEWSECSASCGGGERTRSRKGIPEEGELYGGQRLEEQGIPSHQKEVCNAQPCPVNATCGEWTEYGECSKTCGGGTQERTRKPWLNNAQHGGLTCMQQHPEGPKDVKDCNTQPCPIDEVPGEWAGWGACSEECGPGKQKRVREDSPQKAMYGGKTIEEQNAALPEGKKILTVEERPCENNPCGPCTLPFTEWTACPTCSGSRRRDAILLFDYYNGKCDMETSQFESCEGHCSTPGSGGGAGSEGEGEGGEEEPEEGSGFSAAAVAGGVVGGLALLGAAGGGAAYAMGGLGGGAQAPTGAENVLETEEAAQNLVEEEKESLISAGDQTEMWAA